MKGGGEVGSVGHIAAHRGPAETIADVKDKSLMIYSRPWSSAGASLQVVAN